MVRRLLFLSAILAATLMAQTVTIVSQSTPGSGGIFVSTFAPATSWTQSNTFSSVTISATLINNSPSSAGAAATGTAFLMTQIGAGTTIAQQIATAPVSTTATASSPTPTTMFSGLTLGPGTYFLVISATIPTGTDSLAWSSQNTPTITVASGVTAGPSFLPGTVAAFPPASTFFNKGRFLFYSALGILGVGGTGTTAVGAPALSPLGMLLLAGLLGFSGLWLVRRHAQAK
jgi:hypothetical protein